MQDHQVEVVPGPHAAARVAGAVVVVAHRGPGRPTEDSPAVRALVALVALVYAAASRRPDGPGALIARDATRWLTARTGAAEPPDFGILSAAGPGQVAIFLHGAVTAVLAGAATEYLHGRDAVFTVDRAADVPARAVALFVAEPRADDCDETSDEPARPELPETRGIGRLVEGVAEAGGVVCWSPGASRVATAQRRGPARGVALGKAAARPQQTARSRVESVADVRAEQPIAGSAAAPEEQGSDQPHSTAVGEQGRAVSIGPGLGEATAEVDSAGVPGPAPGSVAVPPAAPVRDQATGPAALAPRGPGAADDPASAPAPDRHHARTEISGRQERSASLNHLADETRDSRPQPGDPPTSADSTYPTPRRAQPLIGAALHGPPERSASPPDAELRRRTAATAKGPAMTVKVRGFKCARAHPTDPRAVFCSVCAMPVDQTQPLIDVVRPPLGILVLDDGASHVLDADSVIGRDPATSEPARRGLTPLTLADNSGGMSRAHVELLLREWDVTLVDRGSTNGTSTRVAGHLEWVRIPPNHPVVLVPRTEILIGKRILRFESAAPPPFGS